jgi:hypothetical protein
MTTERKDGGPVHPVHDAGQLLHEGLSLRDWFAGQALQNYNLHNETPARAAVWAYAIADAMLSERQKGGA